MAHRMIGELTLGAVLARLEEREREITTQAEERREQIAQLTARLDELRRAAEEVRITRKTLLRLPNPQPPAPPAPKLSEMPSAVAPLPDRVMAPHLLRAVASSVLLLSCTDPHRITLHNG
ncbi:hypothetical protein [Streptomyces sp. DH10]|uniref:hypothetical protein n=1 Tax=Streptomyces sp. DH10 TaxID=3040121 RepID=UPI0024424235|nr:hypothetical protein [Streptomyces sp. DH10]MDG9709619.1 hypothetical protein [Streptomyces sp. DH10]